MKKDLQLNKQTCSPLNNTRQRIFRSSQKFSFLAKNFEGSYQTMANKAVLIGINYPGTKIELKGCVNDVHRMHKCLVDRYGFSEKDITVLIDTDESYTKPTGKNIRNALSELITPAKSGDVLFVHYSGHGTRVPLEEGEEDETGFDECIVPCDMNPIPGKQIIYI